MRTTRMAMRHTMQAPLRRQRTIVRCMLVSAFVGFAAAASATTATAVTLPSGFTETVVMSGLETPTAVRFGPNGKVYVAEKAGVVKEFDGLADTTPRVVADLRTKVMDYFDRGLLGL